MNIFKDKIIYKADMKKVPEVNVIATRLGYKYKLDNSFLQ